MWKWGYSNNIEKRSFRSLFCDFDSLLSVKFNHLGHSLTYYESKKIVSLCYTFVFTNALCYTYSGGSQTLLRKLWWKM